MSLLVLSDVRPNTEQMSGEVQQAKITALHHDWQMAALTLGAVREWVSTLAHLPDETRVLCAGLRDTANHPFNRPMSGGILDVVEVITPLPDHP